MTSADAVVDLRSAVSRPLVQPLLVGAAALGATAIAYAFKPGESALLLPCPVHELTGILCPACGTTRALHALTHGQFVDALHNNALFVLVLPLLVYAWLSWFSERLGRNAIPKPRINGAMSYAIAAGVIAFALARNFTPFNVLAPLPV